MEKKEVKRLAAARLKRIGVLTGRTYFRAVVENSVTQDDVLDPQFWELVGTAFTGAGMLPRVEIVPDDQSWLAEYVVMNYGKTHAVLKKLYGIEIGKVEQVDAVDDGMKVAWGGPHAKHRVVNRSGQIVKEGFETKEDANSFLKEHRKVISA